MDSMPHIIEKIMSTLEEANKKMESGESLTNEEIALLTRDTEFFEVSDPKSKGLGDTIKKVTSKLGIKQCGGCKKRQEKLNRLFPYTKHEKKDT